MNKAQNSYNWAILGCGRIAGKFSTDLKLLNRATLYATASRDLHKAEEFKDQYGYQKAYGSYVEMLEDPQVDIVYIATPHALHMEHAILCLQHKKAVLCEKAFAMNSHEVNKMIEASKLHNTFLMEAFWTIFQPKFRQILKLCKDPEMGALKFLKSDFMFNAEFNPEKRLYNIDLGAGSLLDIGIYPIFRALMYLGKPKMIKTMAHIRPTGVEDSISMLFQYEDAMAVLSSSFEASCKNETELCFENGYVKYEKEAGDELLVVKNGEELFIECDTPQGMGYELEAEHVMNCLDQGLIESKELPWSISLDLMSLLDAVRKDAGISFPNDDLGEN